MCEERVSVLHIVTVSASSSRHLVAHVDLGETEGAEMRVGALHRRLDGLSEQLVHELADERPHLLHRLKGGQEAESGTIRQIHHVDMASGERLESFQKTFHILGNRC